MKQPLKHLLQLPVQYKQQWIAMLAAVKARFKCQKEGPYRSEREFMAIYVIRLATGM